MGVAKIRPGPHACEPLARHARTKSALNGLRSQADGSAGELHHVSLEMMRILLGSLPAVILLLAPLTAGRGQQHSMPGSGHIVVPKGAAYTAADVEFMQGMIAHHAQAIHMSRMAEARKANPRVIKLAVKIDQSQVAEIRIMQDWLRNHGQHAPDTSSWRSMAMPGMVTAAQLARLDSAQGVAFDRAFLELMILHHEGALKMVEDLFKTPRAGQEVDVSVFANDVVTVQTAEIGIMRQLLSQLPN